MVGPNVILNEIPQLDTTNSSVDIDLIGIAKNNNESMPNVLIYNKINHTFTTKPHLLTFLIAVVVIVTKYLM